MRCRNRGPWANCGRDTGADRPERGGLYRSRNGRFLGVCKGIADYFGIKPIWIRLFVILAAMATAFWPVLGLYVILGLILKPEPVQQPQDASEREFYESYASSRSMALERLKRKFEALDRRIRRIEDHVTSREYDWQRRFEGR